MTTPHPELTDSVRNAVHAEDCEREGHRLDVGRLLEASPSGRGQELVIRNDPEEEPYVHCTRCGTVWLALLQEAPTYDDAVTRIKDRVKPDTLIRPGKRTKNA